MSFCCRKNTLTPVVIIGSGLAGYTLARELRKIDLSVPILLISRDSAAFYTKPMLSNAFAQGRTAESLRIKEADAMADELDIQVCPNVEVLSIDRDFQRLYLSNGEQPEYRDLVLAVGADPIRLSLEGSAADKVLSVNDLDDFARYAKKLIRVKRIAILGAGLIGCEFANDLLVRNIEPIVIDPAAWPLGRLLPQAAGEFAKKKLTAAGINFRFEQAAKRIDPINDGFRVVLDNGDNIDVDLALSAVGLQPRTQLAQAAGLLSNRGITTDRLLRTSDPHIYALGDCAEVAGLCLPYVQPITHAARALAATLATRPTQVVYPAMPVIVKTPACPTIVSPPAKDSQGEWQISETSGGMDARYMGAQGELLGFALLGETTRLRATLTPQLPSLLPAGND